MFHNNPSKRVFETVLSGERDKQIQSFFDKCKTSLIYIIKIKIINSVKYNFKPISAWKRRELNSHGFSVQLITNRNDKVKEDALAHLSGHLLGLSKEYKK